MPTKQWDHFEFKIAEHYLSALINGDVTGLEADEADEFRAWEIAAHNKAREAGYSVGHWADMDGSSEDWGRCAITGLFAMRTTVHLMVYRSDSTGD